jgi:lipoprotein-anchoring transpeptidase ErfK/SrfK
MRFFALSGRHVGLMTADELARKMFFDGPSLITTWNKNDFGKWSWNLKNNGHRTPYFIHTTPDDEAATAAGKSFELVQSHGCVHLRPRDRDEMMAVGALKAGREVQVMRYGQVGPPR